MCYSKTCVKQPLSQRPKISFQDQLSLNAGQMYYQAEGLSLCLSVFPSFRPPIEVGILWVQLLLQFYTDPFETSLVLWSWSEDMHVVWI